MLGMNDLKHGTVILVNNEPYSIVSYTHGGTGRGGSVMKTVMKNLLTGKTLQQTFQQSDKIEEADVERRKTQFLYESAGNYTFMDEETYEQFDFSKDDLGDAAGYLVEGQVCHAMYFNQNPVAVTLPPSVTLTVTETVPGVKGDTATGGTKPATLESGLVVQVPLFVKEGEALLINTQTGEYQSRA
ncbi:MAG: elongation factor P [Patescibacteria group bacterium]|nr:elongation factor P [Patescibacteria group bacterium]